MNQNNIPLPNAAPSLAAPYAKMIVAIIFGAGLGVAAYYYLLNKDALAAGGGGGTAAPSELCACPSCGMKVNRPKGLDCEEINCPNCGNAMNNAAMFIGALVTPGGAAGAPPLTQNRRETLAEQGVATPGPMNQNQRETLAEQNNLPAQNQPQFLQQPPQQQLAPPPRMNNAPQPAAADMAMQLDANICICPNCGRKVESQKGFSCSNVRCQVCNSAMTNSIFVGRPQDMKLVGMGTTRQKQSAPIANAPCPLTAAATTQGQMALPCPVHGQHPSPSYGPVPAANFAATQAITYSNSINPLIEKNCLRCHGGPIRTLRTYSQVKVYADNGLLRLMTQPGGPMSRFLTSEESHHINTWIKSGAMP